VRLAVTPEQIGLCGCWQVIAVERYSREQHKPEESASLEIGYYATSLTVDERSDAEILAAIRGHWSAIENGTHYRRDVTLGEDACRTANRKGAAVLASLRNLANGIYELQKERKETKADTLKSWCEQQTFTTVWPILNK
jgi:predicted transposase YbfD/YdcC